MSVVVRLRKGITDHLQLRASEWAMLWASGMVGFGLHLQPQLFMASPAYRNLLEWMSQQGWAVLFLACTALRLIALGINGTFHERFPYSPHIRMAVACLSAVVWAQMGYGFFIEWFEAGKAWIVVSLLSLAVILEYINAFRSSRDLWSVDRREEKANGSS